MKAFVRSATSFEILSFNPATSSATADSRSLTVLFNDSVKFFVRRTSRSVIEVFNPAISISMPAICSTMSLYCSKVAKVALTQSSVPFNSFPAYDFKSEILPSKSASFFFRSEIAPPMSDNFTFISDFIVSRVTRTSFSACSIALISSSLLALSLFLNSSTAFSRSDFTAEIRFPFSVIAFLRSQAVSSREPIMSFMSLSVCSNFGMEALIFSICWFMDVTHASFPFRSS